MKVHLCNDTFMQNKRAAHHKPTCIQSVRVHIQRRSGSGDNTSMPVQGEPVMYATQREAIVHVRYFDFCYRKLKLMKIVSIRIFLRYLSLFR